MSDRSSYMRDWYRARKARAGQPEPKPRGRKKGHFNIPEHVLTEAIRASAAPVSLTAAICGDPPPGRSALDRRA